MNAIGKILVVFVTAASLGFLAFVIALLNGGPDWVGEMRSGDLNRDFILGVSTGETTTYSSRQRLTNTSVVEKTSVAAEIVVKSRKRLEDDANKRLQELTPQVTPLKNFLAYVKKTIPEDDKGVHVRFENIEARVKQLQAQLNTVGTQFSQATIQTQEVLNVAQDRREEAYRLSNQLDMMRTDQFSTEVQEKALKYELESLKENRRRLERRKIQLKQQLGESYEE
jgi:hypothetical protein